MKQIIPAQTNVRLIEERLAKMGEVKNIKPFKKR
jgi:hypothetical protein